MSRDAARLTKRCRDMGLDLHAAFAIQDYNAAVDAPYQVADFGRARTLAMVVGNTRTIWPHALAGCEPDLDHPLDTWVERSVRGVLTELEARTQVWFPHEPPPRQLPFRRLAQIAGLGWLGPAMLLVHPQFGPWISLRALVVLDETGPAAIAVPTPDPCGSCQSGCGPRFEEALSAGPSGDWLAVRDACPLGHDYRFSQDQIAYHYTKNRELLRPR